MRNIYLDILNDKGDGNEKDFSTLCRCSFASEADLQKQIEKLKKQLDRQKEQISTIKAHDSGDNIKFSADLRTSYDFVDYDVKGADNQSNSVWSNRFILNMAAQPAEELIFKGALQANKLFGNNKGATTASFQNYDWFASETPDDAILRLREAYFVYIGDMGSVPYTVSFGRRPAIGGLTGNLREGDPAASPIAHNINMEFDGASFKFDFENMTDIPGIYFKLCMGRGNTDADGKYADSTPYTSNAADTPDMDMIGLMAQLYNDGQYQVLTNYFQAVNVFGFKDMADFATGTMTKTGHMSGGAMALYTDGVGDELSDFLDDTKAFVSFAWSTTDPSDGGMMLGSADKETGTSFFVGVQTPCLLSEDARLGFEYNHGSKYWRSFTYGEDTLIGSRLAARGDAYEAYWTKPLVGKNLSMQLRYTYIDYDYTGSDGFFGNISGTPVAIADAGAGTVESASNIRAYIRYRY